MNATEQMELLAPIRQDLQRTHQVFTERLDALTTRVMELEFKNEVLCRQIDALSNEQQETEVPLSIPQAARVLGVSRASIDKAIHRGEIKYIKMGRKHLIPGSEVKRLLAGERKITKG